MADFLKYTSLVGWLLYKNDSDSIVEVTNNSSVTWIKTGQTRDTRVTGSFNVGMSTGGPSMGMGFSKEQMQRCSTERIQPSRRGPTFITVGKGHYTVTFKGEGTDVYLYISISNPDFGKNKISAIVSNGNNNWKYAYNQCVCHYEDYGRDSCGAFKTKFDNKSGDPHMAFVDIQEEIDDDVADVAKTAGFTSCGYCPKGYCSPSCRNFKLIEEEEEEERRRRKARIEGGGGR